MPKVNQKIVDKAASKNPLLEEFQEILKEKSVTKCKAGKMTEELSEEDILKYESALATNTGTIPSSTIEVWLNRRGLRVSSKLLNDHRKGNCACR